MSSEFVVIAAFTNVHEAHLVRSVLEGAGIDVMVQDEHLISMAWTYSNAVGGVKVLVPQDRLEEARALLRSGAMQVEPESAYADLSWLTVGLLVGSPVRRWQCKSCGARRTWSESHVRTLRDQERGGGSCCFTRGFSL